MSSDNSFDLITTSQTVNYLTSQWTCNVFITSNIVSHDYDTNAYIHYKFENQSNLLSDSTANGKHLMNYGGIYINNSNFNCLYLQSNNYAIIPAEDWSVYSNLTISTWFKTENYQNINSFFHDTANLEIWYKFDNNINDMLLDSSGKSRSATNNNATFDNSNFLIGNGSLNLNGTAQWVNINSAVNPYSIANANGITYSIWFNYSTVSGTWARILEQGNNIVTDPTEWIVITKTSTNNTLTFEIGTSSTTKTTFNTPLNYIDNNWHHVVWSITSTGTWNIYIDNTQLTITNSGNGAYPRTVPSGVTWQRQSIGRSLFSGSGGPVGNIDDFRIYNKILSQQEINILYSAGQNTIKLLEFGDTFYNNTSNLVAWYQCNDNRNNMLLDSSGNGNHLTNNNNCTFDTTTFRTGNGSIYLNGSTQYLDLPATINPYNIWNSGNGITFAVWFDMSTSSGTWARIFDFSDNAINAVANNWISINKTSTGTTLYFEININASKTNFTTSISYVDNNWHHIVFSISSIGIWTIYIDNVQQILSGTGANGALSGTYPKVIPNATWTKRYIGRSGNGTGDGWYIGNIDDFRIYNKVLTQWEVNTLYTMGDNLVIKRQNNKLLFEVNSMPVIETTSFKDSEWNHLIWNVNTTSNQGYIEINNGTKAYFNKTAMTPVSIQYPPYPMTAYENTFFGYTYRACAYNLYDPTNFPPWYNFDRNTGSRAISAANYTTAGALTITGVSFGNDSNFKGTYFGIDMGQPLIIDYYRIVQYVIDRKPKFWKLYATNNDACWNATGGTSSTACFNTGPEYGWVQIDARYNETTYLDTTNFYVNRTLPYRYFAINANSMIGSGNNGQYFDIHEWQIFGYNPTTQIMQFPPVSMTGFSTTYAGITYRACSYDFYNTSPEFGYAWKAFDRNNTSTTRYISATGFDTNGVLNITGVSFGLDTSYRGVYLGIDMGQQIIMKYYYIIEILNGRKPRNWKIYATNDDKCWNPIGGTVLTPAFNTDAAYGWTQIDVRTQEIYYTNLTRFSIDNSIPYRYYAIHVNAVIGASAFYFDIYEWQIFGLPYYPYFNSLGSSTNKTNIYLSDFRIHTSVLLTYEEDRTYGILNTINNNGIYLLDTKNSIIIPQRDFLSFTSTAWNTSNDFSIAGWFKTEGLQNGDILFETRQDDIITITNTTNNHIIPNTLTLASFNYGTSVPIAPGTYNITFSSGTISISSINDKSFPILKTSTGYTINPLLWYQFNTGMLTRDYGMARIDLSIVGTGGAGDTSTFVKGNSSVYFTTAANYFKTTTSINKNVPLTIAFWFRVPTAYKNSYTTMISYTNSVLNNPCIQFDYHGSTAPAYKLRVYTALDTHWSTQPTSATSFQVDTWYHVAYTLDSGSTVTGSLYINGVLESTATGTAGKILDTAKLGYVVIGYSGDLGRGYGGFIDDYRFYDFALSLTQIQELYRGRVDINNTRSIRCMKNNDQLSFQINNLSIYDTSFPDNAWNHIIWNAVNTASHQAFVKINNNKTIVNEFVPNLPIIRYPPAAMTSSSAIFNSGTYNVTASSYNSITEIHYNAFNYNNSTNANTNWWTISSASYSSVNGSYLGTITTNISGTIVAGEWLQIQMPFAIILNNYNIYTASSDLTRGPKDFQIAGSNDGITWFLVDSETNITSYTSSGKSFVTSTVQAYTYFRLIILSNNNNTLVTIMEWEIFGCPLQTYTNTLGSVNNQGKIYVNNFQIIANPMTTAIENQLYNVIPYDGITYDQKIKYNNIELSSNEIIVYNSSYTNTYPYLHYEFKSQQMLPNDSSSNLRYLNNNGGSYTFDFARNSIYLKNNTEAWVQTDDWSQYSNLSISTWFKTDNFRNNDKIIDFYQNPAQFIQVDQYIKYPKDAMTSDSTTSTATGIVTRCKATTNTNGLPFNLFNYNTFDEGGNSYHSSAVYAQATGVTTTAYFTGYAGEAILIDLGVNIILKQLRFYPRASSLLMRCPGIFRIYATNDVSKFNTPTYSGWDIIHDQSTRLTTANYSYTQPTIVDINNNNSYRIYALVVNALSGSGVANNTILNFAEWELYGKEASYITQPLLPIQISGGDYYYALTGSNMAYDITFLEDTTCQLFMIAGGGGAGYNHGGGGGAGAYYYNSNYTFNAGTYRCIVGAGGNGETSGGTMQAMNGQDTIIQNSSIDIFRCKGGGYGGSYANNTSTYFIGGNGGCGGGGLGWDGNSTGSRTYAGGSTTNSDNVGTGNAGGSSVHNYGAGNLSGGGGGGIGSVGQNSFLNASTGRYEGGNGGNALIFNIKGFEEIYGGGGGGGEWPSYSVDPAGLGGGATLTNGIFYRVGGNAVRTENTAGGDAMVNTGSGGGSGKGGKGGNGSSGIIIIRFHTGLKIAENATNQLSFFINNRLLYTTSNIFDNQWNHMTWNVINNGSLQGSIRFNNADKLLTNSPTTLLRYPRFIASANTYKYTDSTLVRITGSSVYTPELSTHDYYISFNYSTTDFGWGSINSVYNTTTGVGINTYRSGYTGEYLQIDLGESIILRTFNIYARGGSAAALSRAPRDFRLYASNDVNAWTNINHFSWVLLDDETNISAYTANTAKTFTLNNNTAYRFYVFVINKIFTGSSESMCQIAELELYGYPPPANFFNLVKYPRFTATANTYSYINNTTINITGSTRWYSADPVAMDTHNYYTSFNFSMTDPGWGCINNMYNTTTGNALTTYRTGYAGEYLQIDLGESMILRAFNIYPRSDNSTFLTRAPKDFRIYASNDSNAWTNINHSSWTLLDEEINVPTYTTYVCKTFLVNNTIAYRYYVMIINKIFPNNTANGMVQIAEFELYGIPYFSYINKLGSTTNISDLYLSDFRIITNPMTCNLEDAIYNANTETSSLIDQEYVKDTLKNITSLYYNNIERIETNATGAACKGSVSVTGDVLSYYSDIRLKDIVSEIEEPIEKINKINTFRYIPNDLAHSYTNIDDKIYLGLSAQDVNEVLPEIVSIAPFDREVLQTGDVISKSGESYLTVSYQDMVPVLIECIKELNHEIEELELQNHAF